MTWLSTAATKQHLSHLKGSLDEDCKWQVQSHGNASPRSAECPYNSARRVFWIMGPRRIALASRPV